MAAIQLSRGAAKLRARSVLVQKVTEYVEPNWTDGVSLPGFLFTLGFLEQNPVGNNSSFSLDDAHGATLDVFFYQDSPTAAGLMQIYHQVRSFVPNRLWASLAFGPGVTTQSYRLRGRNFSIQTASTDPGIGTLEAGFYVRNA